MPKFEADIYYSGYVTVSVEAPDEDQALEAAREEAARRHNKREGDFNDELMLTLEPWREADTVRKTE
jgi:hypothetical protein